jgi:hypothetical protein
VTDDKKKAKPGDPASQRAEIVPALSAGEYVVQLRWPVVPGCAAAVPVRGSLLVPLLSLSIYI